MRYLFLSILLVFTMASAQSQACEFCNGKRTLSTNAIGEIEADVDNVVISLSINNRDKNLEAAKKDNDDKYERVLRIINNKFLLPKEAIKSNNISINPRYVSCHKKKNCDPTMVEFYQVNRSLSFKLKEIKKYDAIISELSQSNIRVNASQFGIDNIQKYKDEARETALNAVKAKAQKISQTMGVKLLKPMRIQVFDDEITTLHRRPPQMARIKMAVAMDSSDKMLSTDTETLGKIKVKVNVNVEYEFE